MANPAFSQIVGTSFYHVFDGRSRFMRIRMTKKADGSVVVSRFAPNRNLKLREALMETDEAVEFDGFPLIRKARHLFRIVG